MKRTVGPFTWERKTSTEQRHVWHLVHPVSAAHWCLKDYGTGDGAFSGWRLVSGGPFTDAGKYDSVQAAAKGVIPYLSADIIKDAQQMCEKAQELQEAADAVRRHLAGTPVTDKEWLAQLELQGAKVLQMQRIQVLRADAYYTFCRLAKATWMTEVAREALVFRNLLEAQIIESDGTLGLVSP